MVAISYSVLSENGLAGLPFGITEDGTVIGGDSLTADQLATLHSLIAAYDPVPEAQQRKIAEAATACDAALAPYATRFGVYERDTWALQLAEATAILQDANPTADTYPVIGGIIAHTGESWGDFAEAVKSNSAAWSKISADAIGQRQRIVALIKAATTVEAVEAISTAITVGS